MNSGDLPAQLVLYVFVAYVGIIATIGSLAITWAAVLLGWAGSLIVGRRPTFRSHKGRLFWAVFWLIATWLVLVVYPLHNHSIGATEIDMAAIVVAIGTYWWSLCR